VTAVGPFVPPRPAAAADASASALGGSRVTGNVVPDTRTHTEIPSILANSSPASIPATEPLPADNLDMSAESQGSQPGLEGDLAPSRPAGHRLAIAPKRYLASPTASTPLATTGDTRTAAASSQGAAVATVTRARSNGARATACSATSPCACPARCTAGTAGSTISTATRPPSAA